MPSMDFQVGRFASTPLPELYELHREWLDKELQDFLKPRLVVSYWFKEEHIPIHGCRTGRACFDYLLDYVSRDNYTIYGIDTSPGMIEYAQKKCTHGKGNYVWQEIHMLDWKKPTEETPIQRIYSIHAFQFEPKWRQIIKRNCEVMEEGGKLFGMFLADSGIFKLYEYLKTHPDWTRLGQDLHVPEWNKKHNDVVGLWRDELIAAGYENTTLKLVVHERTHTFATTEDCVEFYLSMNPKPVEDHVKTEQARENLFQTCLQYVKSEEKQAEEGHTIQFSTMVFWATKVRTLKEEKRSNCDKIIVEEKNKREEKTKETL